MWQYTYSDELYHYGVLGMKWGIRKAKKKGTTYTYKSHGQKKWDKKLAKANSSTSKNKEKKISKAERKLQMYSTRDKKRQSYAERTSVGKNIVQNFLISGGYTNMRAAGYGRVPSVLVNGFLTPLLSIPISTILENDAAKHA